MNKEPEISANSPALPPRLVSAGELLETLWPNPATRPSLRWLQRLQSRRAVPFLKLGHKVFFEPDRVQAALRKFEIAAV